MEEMLMTIKTAEMQLIIIIIMKIMMIKSLINTVDNYQDLSVSPQGRQNQGVSHPSKLI